MSGAHQHTTRLALTQSCLQVPMSGSTRLQDEQIVACRVYIHTIGEWAKLGPRLISCTQNSKLEQADWLIRIPYQDQPIRILDSESKTLNPTIVMH